MMKRQNPILLMFLLPAIAVFSCQREKLDGTKAPLVGLWEWRFSIVKNPNAPNPLTAVDTLYAQDFPTVYRIRFEKKGVMSWYENGHRVLKTNLEFIADQCNYASGGQYSVCSYIMKDHRFAFTIVFNWAFAGGPCLYNWSYDGYEYFPHLPVAEGLVYQNCYIKVE